MRVKTLLMKRVLCFALLILLLSAVGMTKAASLTSVPIGDTIKAKTVGVIPYSDDFITQVEVMERNYAITSFRMIDTATVAVLTGASDMILVYSFSQNQIMRKIQLPISARAFDYDNHLFHVIGDRTYLSIDAEGRIRERKDFQEPQLPNEEVFIISDLKIIDGQPIIHECNANTYSITSDGLQKIDTFYYDHARSCKIHPKYIDENNLVVYSETSSKSGRHNVSMESIGLEGKLACLNPISVTDNFIAINLQTTYNCTGSFVKSYLLVVNTNGDLINLVEVPINYLSYISKPFCYKDNAWYYAFSGQEGVSIFKIGTNTNRIDSPDSFILSDYSYREPENEAFHEDTSSHSPARGSMNGWRTITQTWYNGNQYRTLEWSPIEENIAYNCTWIQGLGSSPGYIKTPNYITTQPNATKMGVPYKRAGFTRWQDFKNLAGLGRKTGNCYHPDNTTCSGDCYSETSDAYVIGVDCSGFVSSCWEFSYAVGTYNIPSYCTAHGNVATANESDFQKGDALNWAGHHVMLYTGHTETYHNIAVFESTSTDNAWRTVDNVYDAGYFSQYGRDYKIQRLNFMKNIILRLNSAITMSQNGSTVTTVTRGQPLTVNYSVKNFGSETWSGDVRLFIEQSTGEEVPLNPVYSVTLAPGDSLSFTFSNNEVISPVGTTKFYVRVKNYNAGGDDAYYDVGGGGYSNPLVFEIVEGGNPPTPSCKTCPDYDETWNIIYGIGVGEWTTTSSSIVSDGCRIYKVPMYSGYTYTFQTGCGNGNANFDTQLYLFDGSCNLKVFNDDGCSDHLSSLVYTPESSAWYYLKIDGYNGAGGSFTIAAKREGGDSPSCSECPDYDESWSINNAEVGEWTYKSSSIGTEGCRIYRVPLMSSYTYTFQTGCDNGTADFDTRLYLYDASCNQVAYNDDGCSNHLSSIKYRNTTGSTAYYYLKIDGYDGEGGSYTIAAKRESCSSCPEYDEIWPVNNAGVGNWTYKSSSIVSGGCSIYRVTLSSSYTYTFQTGCDNGTADFDTQLYLYDESCNEVAYDDDGCSNYLSSIEYTNTGSTAYFYLKIKGFGNAAGSYTIAAKRESPPTTFVISASASPSAGGTVSGAGTYQNGSTCTLTATANTGYGFVRWTKDGTQVSTNSTYSFTVTESASYVALFGIYSYPITASASPTAGGTVSGDGTYNYGSSCTLTATPNMGYTFVCWTKNGSQVSTSASYSFTVTESASYVAVFSLNSYTISASANPSAGGNVSGAGTYNYGSTCTLTATPNTGYSFVRWTKNGSQVSTNPSYSFTVTENASYVAVFSLNSYTISVSANPSAGGTVSGGGTYNHGSTCTLTVTTNTGYTFTNWTENGNVVSTEAEYSFTVTSDRELVANFIAVGGVPSIVLEEITSTTYDHVCCHLIITDDGGSPVTMALVGVLDEDGNYLFGFGRVDPSNDFWNCTTSLSPSTTYIFLPHATNSNGTGYGTPVTYTTLPAPVFYTINVTPNPTEGGAVSGAGTYNNGSTCTLTASANSGYEFANWTENGSVVSTNASYAFTVTGDRNLVANFTIQTQTSSLPEGWSWWGTYIEQEGIDGLTQLENSLGENGVMIKSQSDGFISRYGEYWMGLLNSLNNESSYLVQTSGSCDVSLTGYVAVPSSHPITLLPGWTWIGYPSGTAMSVSTALSNLSPIENDMLKAQESFSVYYPSIGWFGSLQTIMPGMGLMFESHNTSSVTLTYPNPTRTEALVENVTARANHWRPDVQAYPHNMNMMAVVEVDGEELQSEDYELAAFADGECRGSAKLMYVEQLHRYMAFLTLHGDDEAELSFGLYDKATGMTAYESDARLVFAANAVAGSPADPMVVSFRDMTGIDSFGGTLHVFPNPVERGSMITIGIAEESDEVRVEIVNALGVVLSTETSKRLPANIKAPEVAGVYMLRITSKGRGISYVKLIVR